MKTVNLKLIFFSVLVLAVSEVVSRFVIYLPNFDIAVGLLIAYATLRHSRDTALALIVIATIYLGALHEWRPITLDVGEKLLFWLFVLSATYAVVAHFRRQLVSDEKEKERLRRVELTKLVSERTKEIAALTESIPQIVWQTDAHGKLTYMNQNWAKFTGKDPAESSWTDMFHEEDAKISEAAWRKSVTAKIPYNIEFRIRGKTGEYRWHLSRGVPVLNESGEIEKWIGTITDIQEQKDAFAAREASRMKTQFLANMSHEIRTPINGVIGVAGLLSDTELSSEQRSYVDLIKHSGDLLLQLVNDVLDLSRAESGKVDVERIPMDVRQAIQDVEQILNFAASKKKLRLYSKVNDAIPEMVLGDPTRIRQVLVNLVNNAIKFSETGFVAIEGSIVSDGGIRKLQFEVIDSGIGISVEGQRKIFEAFTQEDASTSRRFGGSGLGLSISKHLVEIMGGEIGVRSKKGEGSTFWFQLPLLKANDIRATASDLPTTNSNRRLKILIAEDNSVNQLITRKMVEKMGHDPVVVANGKEVLEALMTASYDLILMDCQMPEMDGYTATRLIRAGAVDGYNELPIVAMTANAMTGDREKCLQSGMNDYIAKPVKSEELEVVIVKNASPVSP